MDDDYKKSFQIIKALLMTSDHALAACQAELIRHTSEHFKHVNDWRRKPNISARQCHLDVHTAHQCSRLPSRTVVLQGIVRVDTAACATPRFDIDRLDLQISLERQA